MLSQTDLERERYESRRKAQLNYNTGMLSARMEGEEKGLEEGKIRIIRMLHKLRTPSRTS
jgi:hypothetical protein